MDFLAEAEQEITAGNLWRAKEILHRSLKNSGYNVQLFEKLGIVLLQMNDLVEAGKYLFLSGVRKPEYEKAIGTFLQKYEGKPHNLFHPFPRSAKLSKISDYPETVAAKLRELGFSDGLETVHGIHSNSPLGSGGKIALVVFFLIVLAIIVLLILGIVKLFEIVF
ncbi:MAG: tetratricopeptide repeat protein [Pyrinomonadaceae bacterium]